MHRPLFRWLSAVVPAVAGVFTLAATGNAAPRVPTHVACVGDSITEGVGADPGKSWPDQLRELFAASGPTVKVGNFGASGRTMLKSGDSPYWTTTDKFAGAQDFVKKAGADAVVDVVIMLGTNDSKNDPQGVNNWKPNAAGKSAGDQYSDDYRAMIELFAALPTKPLVFLAFPPPVYSHDDWMSNGVIKNEEIPILKKIAAEKQLPTLDVYAALSNHSDFFPDGVHPNNDGAGLIAKAIHDGLLADLSVASGAAGGGSAGASAGGITTSPQQSKPNVTTAGPRSASAGSGGQGASSSGNAPSSGDDSSGCVYGHRAGRELGDDAASALAAALLAFGMVAMGRRRLTTR